MRADLRALVGIEEALEQGAEDCRIDQAPVETGRRDQQADIAVIEPNGPPAVEQSAVEMRDIGQVELTTMLHRLEQ